MRQKSKEHQWLEMIIGRGAGNEKEARELNALETGYAGELEFDRWVDAYKDPEWIVMKDIWIEAGGVTQLDTVIITNEGVYIFDVKNYSHAYTYENGAWLMNGRPMIKDIFVQLKRSIEKVNTMRKYTGIPFELKETIVFINEHATVEVKEKIRDPYILRNEIKNYFNKMKRSSGHGQFNPFHLQSEIKRFIIDNPYQPKVLEMSRYPDLVKGIRCVKCGGFELTAIRYHMVCSCGYREVKEKAIIRTICEYGVLKHDADLSTRELMMFLNGSVSYRNLRSVMHKYFIKVKGGRYTRYENPRQIYEYAFKNHEFRYKDSYTR